MTNINTFVAAFMVKAKAEIGDGAYDALVALWESPENQNSLELTFKKQRKSSRTGKKLKDKNAPKRAKSAYIYFCSDMRTQAKENLGEDATIGDVGKELGRLWNQIKATDEADQYKALAEQDKLRYKNEMDGYVVEEESSEDEPNVSPKVSPKVAKKSSGKKKRSKPAYAFFCSEMRPQIKEENPEMSAKEIMKELGKRWKEAKESDTSKWDELAKQDKAFSDMEEDTEPETETEIETEKSPTPKKSTGKKSTGKKKRVYAAALWKNTCKDSIAEETGKSGSELIKELAKRWKALSNDEREEWREKAKNM